MLSQLQKANPGQVRIIFHHYPLDQECNPARERQTHPGACLAAFAAECAGEQGKFGEYAALLFGDQKQQSRRDLESYATTLRLSLDRFSVCLDDGRMERRVSEDIKEAQRIGVRLTPTFAINGRLIEGLLTPKNLATLITLQKQQPVSDTSRTSAPSAPVSDNPQAGGHAR